MPIPRERGTVVAKLVIQFFGERQWHHMMRATAGVVVIHGAFFVALTPTVLLRSIWGVRAAMAGSFYACDTVLGAREEQENRPGEYTKSHQQCENPSHERRDVSG